MTTPERRKVSVRMSDEETWELIATSHTAIFTTLRASGAPIALPVWFVARGREIYVRTRGKKLRRVENDPRCSFLVEAGERWRDLRAVHISGRGEFVPADPEFEAWYDQTLAAKYSSFQTPQEEMPLATRDLYQTAYRRIIRIVPEGKILTWDNRHLGVGKERQPGSPGRAESP